MNFQKFKEYYKKEFRYFYHDFESYNSFSTLVRSVRPGLFVIVILYMHKMLEKNYNDNYVNAE